MEEPIKSLCQNSKSDECRTCIGPNCNTKQTFTRCLHCDSALDPLCAINPQESIFSKVCDAYEDKCYINILKFNVTRGCLSEQKVVFENDECKNSRKCAICSETNGFGCNNRAIVMETCVHCDTKNGEDCSDDLDIFKGKVCSDIDSTEKQGCYLSIVSKFTKILEEKKSLFFNQMLIYEFFYKYRMKLILQEDVSVILVVLENQNVLANRNCVKRALVKIVILKNVFKNALIAIANIIMNVWEMKPPILNNVKIISVLV